MQNLQIAGGSIILFQARKVILHDVNRQNSDQTTSFLDLLLSNQFSLVTMFYISMIDIKR